MNHDMYEQIERYLSGQLDSQERIAFELAMVNDRKLADEVHKQRLLTNSMKLYGRRMQLKKQMNTFHEEMKADDVSGNFKVSRYGWGVIWKKYMPTVAVAASVAIITVISTLLTISRLRTVDNRQITNFQQLKREVASIKKAQRDISNAVLSQGAIEASPSARYSATGFMISPNGYVVTNYHVVKEADSVYIESTGDVVHRYKVKVIYKDPTVDLALLKIEDAHFEPLKRLPFALNIKEADLAEPVYTLGYPGDDLVYNDGSISSHRGFDGDTSAYRISIPVNPGNSGGPLLDHAGNLIGVISGKNTAAEGVSFAVKSKYLMRMIQSISPDSLPSPVALSKKGYMRDLNRPEQIKKLQGLVFNVRVYKSGV